MIPEGAAPSSGRRLPYLPALDGLRGLAVAAVLLFHSDLGWAEGGHLGVTTFFTLSGFLITALLLVERDRSGRISLGSFWARRARRLVPAMLVCFALIAVVLALTEEALPSGLIGDAVASASWMANWRFILAEGSYADLFATPSPFQHFWSLAVEEQFYVVFPLVVVGLTAARRSSTRRWTLAVVLSAVIVASTVQLAALHERAGATSRAYYGTDARVAEILVGALLATVLVGPGGLRVLRGPARAASATTGLAGLAGLAAAYVSWGDRDTALYQGGFLAVAVCAAAVIASACQPGSPVGRILGVGALVRLGWISYGTYLFHWPIFILVDERRTGLGPAPLLAVRCGLTIALAVVSYALVESPIRHGRLPGRVAVLGWVNGAVAAIAVVALASGQLPTAPAGADGPGDVVAAGVAGASTTTTVPGPTPAGAADPTQGAQPLAGDAAQPSGPTPTTEAQPPPSGEQVPHGFAADPEQASVHPVPEGPPGALRVAVVGDSIAENLAAGLAVWAAERGDVVVYDASVRGCPVSRGGERRFGSGDPFRVSPICSWWDGDGSEERMEAMRRFAPEVVLVHDGVNEMLDRRLDDWGDFRRPGDPRLDSWLREEYREAMSTWVEPYGSTVVVANAPCADWDRYEKFRTIEDAEVRIQALNTSVYPQLLEASVADLFERVCPGGTYRNEVEGYASGRPDGFHFSDDASAALARNWLGPLILEARSSPTPLLPSA